MAVSVPYGGGGQGYRRLIIKEIDGVVQHSWNEPISEIEMIRLSQEIDRDGYGVIQNFLSENEIGPLREFAEATVQASGGEYIGLTNPKALAGTLLSRLQTSVALNNVCQGLTDIRTGELGKTFNIMQIIRFLRGSSGREASARFHYDSYIVTAVLPIAIPPGEGNLLLMRSSRPIRHWYLRNVFDKLMIEGKRIQKRLQVLSQSKSELIISIKLKPGDLYLFWGYQSIHTNQPCDPTKLRATAVYHYGDPHLQSTLRAMIRRYRGIKQPGYAG
jgi:hypothetical protein